MHVFNWRCSFEIFIKSVSNLVTILFIIFILLEEEGWNTSSSSSSLMSFKSFVVLLESRHILTLSDTLDTPHNFFWWIHFFFFFRTQLKESKQASLGSYLLPFHLPSLSFFSYFISPTKEFIIGMECIFSIMYIFSQGDSY